MLAALAWRNIWRRPNRTALSLASIVVACIVTVFVLALQRGSYGTMEESVLRLVDGFAQIQPQGYSEDPDLRKTITDYAGLMTELDRVPGVTASAPRAMTYAILSDGPRSYGSAIYGIDPQLEDRVSSLAGTVTKGRFLQSGDGAAVVVGAGLARNLKLSIGSSLTLLGSARDGSVAADVLKVVGIFATGSPDIDRQVVEIPLSRFQADFAMAGRVNVIAVVGKRLANVQASLPRLRRIAQGHGLVLKDWTELEPALHDVILLDMSFSSLLYVSLIVVVVFIILNTLLMSVLERTREFGMLLAIGMRPGQIGRMVWFELFFLAGCGAVIGVALGAAITAWVASQGITFQGAEALFKQWHLPATIYPELDPISAFAGPLAIAVSIVVAGLIPYMRVRSLRPVSAMRSP